MQKKSSLEILCKKISSVRNTSVLAIILPDEPISYPHVLKIYKHFCDIECENLDIILHSLGGDIHATYKIIELLRNHCEQMTTIVPLFAKSAASLFVLVSDQVIMSELAEIGPLDAQIMEREKGGIKYTSALNPFKALEELQKFSLQTLDMTVKLILRRAEFSIEESLKYGIDLSSKLSTSLISQLNAEKVGEYSRALLVGREYGERLLRRYSKWKDELERDNILERFVMGYPSHDYIIDYKELREIGLDVILPPENEKLILKEMVDYLVKVKESEILFENECKINKTKRKEVKKDD